MRCNTCQDHADRASEAVGRAILELVHESVRFLLVVVGGGAGGVIHRCDQNITTAAATARSKRSLEDGGQLRHHAVLLQNRGNCSEVGDIVQCPESRQLYLGLLVINQAKVRASASADMKPAGTNFDSY